MLGPREAQVLRARRRRRKSAREAARHRPARDRSRQAHRCDLCDRARRLLVRRQRTVVLVDDLEAWMRTERARLSRHAEVAKAMDYMLKRWAAFARFVDDGRICLSNNAAERALRGIAL